MHLFSSAWKNTAWKWKWHIPLIFFKHSEENPSSPRIMFMSSFMKCFLLDLNIARILLLYADAISLFHLSHRYLLLSPSIALFNYFRKISHLNELIWHFQWNLSHSASPYVIIQNDFCTSLTVELRCGNFICWLNICFRYD